MNSQQGSSTYTINDTGESIPPGLTSDVTLKKDETTLFHLAQISILSYQFFIVRIKATGTCLFINFIYNTGWTNLLKALKHQLSRDLSWSHS